jgi:hypothetical protein
MSDVSIYLSAFWWHGWSVLLTGLVFVAAELCGVTRPGVRVWLDRIRAPVRVGIEIAVMFALTVHAGFVAWHAEHRQTMTARADLAGAMNQIATLKSANDLRRARIDVNQFDLYKQHGVSYPNVHYRNVGQSTTNTPISWWESGWFDRPPTDSEIDAQFERNVAGMRTMTVPNTIASEVEPGMGLYFTAVKLGLDDKSLKKFTSGEKVLLFTVIFKAFDEDHGPNTINVTEFCGIFSKTFTTWVTCPRHNRHYTEQRVVSEATNLRIFPFSDASQ